MKRFLIWGVLALLGWQLAAEPVEARCRAGGRWRHGGHHRHFLFRNRC